MIHASAIRPENLRRIPSAGRFVAAGVFALVTLGLLVLFSASQSMHTEATYLLRKQLAWLGCAVVAGLIALAADLEALRRHAGLLALGSLAVLGVTLVPGIGVEVNGARRWIGFGPMQLQAAAVGKLGLLFALAHYLAAHRRDLGELVRGFLAPIGLLGAFCGLIFLQPDYGTTFLCGAVGATMLFLAGGRLRYLIPAASAATGFFAIAVMSNPERLERVVSFLNLRETREGAGYQLWQGILAFGAGGIDGVGLGNGRQQMSFLPEAHTDFIFAVIGEEMGLMFTAGVTLLFGAIFLVGMLQLRRAPNLYQYLLVSGALLFITLQALINMGVVTGCLPTKGMSLPFISYGGSNLVLMFVLIGIILNGFRTWEGPAWGRSGAREL